MCKSRALLVIGIDGGTWTILDRALEGGYMPHLKDLVDTGASGILKSTVPAITPAAWGAFQTGTNPGKTGVFDFYAWDKDKKQGQLRSTPVSSRLLKRTIWETASEAGKHVGAVNVPVTYPPVPLNGYMVSGVLTPSLDSQFTYPVELKGELLGAVPEYDILNLGKIGDYSRSKNPEAFLELMVAALRTRSRAAQYVIQKEALDLFMIHFQAPDVVQHVLWGYLDPRHPLYDERTSFRILECFYGHLDAEIKQIRRAFEETVAQDYATLVISDHGFQSHRKRFNLGNWLHREGYLRLNAKSFQESLPVRLVKCLDILRIRKHLSIALRSWGEETLSGVSGGPNEIYWDTTQAFSLGRSSEGFIYIMAQERSPEYGNALASIAEYLNALRDPETNLPVVANVYRKQELFSGEYLDSMPDLVIEPAPGYSFTGQYQPGEGLFQEVKPTDAHVGKHHADGIIIAAGDGIEPQVGMTARLIDMAPTILYYLELPISTDIDGRLVQELFTNDFTNTHSARYDSGTGTRQEASDAAVYSSEEEKAIERRLEDLGYL